MLASEPGIAPGAHHPDLLPPELADTPLCLTAAIAEAKERSPGLKRTRAHVEQQHWQLRGERATFLPRLNLFASYVPLFAFTKMAIGATPKDDVVTLRDSMSQIGASLFLPAFDGMQNVYRLRAQRLQFMAAEHTHTWEDFVTERLVRYRYREVQAAGLLEEAALEQVKSLMGHVEQVTSLRGQRSATDFDLLRAQVRLTDAQTERLKAADRVVVSRRNLAQTMGLLADDRPLVGTLPEVDAHATEQVAAIDSRAAPQRLDVLALGQLQQAQHALRDAAKNFWLPKVDVIGNFSRYNNWDRSITHPDLYNNAYTVGIRVQMNVFDGGAASSRARAATFEGVKIEQQQRELVLRQGYAIEQARRGYLYAHALYAARSLNIERARKNLQIAAAGYKYGSQNSTDVLDAQSDLYNAQAEAVRAQLAIEEHAMALELALGKELG